MGTPRSFAAPRASSRLTAAARTLAWRATRVANFGSAMASIGTATTPANRQPRNAASHSPEFSPQIRMRSAFCDALGGEIFGKLMARFAGVRRRSSGWCGSLGARRLRFRGVGANRVGNIRGGIGGAWRSSVAYSWTVWEWRWDTIAGFESVRWLRVHSGKCGEVATSGTACRAPTGEKATAKRTRLRREPSNGDCGAAVQWRRLKPTLLNDENNDVAMLAKQWGS